MKLYADKKNLWIRDLILTFFVFGLVGCTVNHPIEKEKTITKCSPEQAGACDTEVDIVRDVKSSFSLTNTMMLLGVVALLAANESKD